MAYTCDDLQSDVEWRYVELIKNLNWIKDITSGRKNFPSEQLSSSQISSGIENRIDNSNIIQENGLDNTKERIKKDQEQSLKTMNAEDNLKLINAKFNNRPSAKDGIPTKEIVFSQTSNYSSASENLFSWHNLGGKKGGGPRIAVNKCFLKEDGTMVCQSQTTFSEN